MTIQPTTSRASRLLVTCLTIGLMVAGCGSDDDTVIDDDDHRARR